MGSARAGGWSVTLGTGLAAGTCPRSRSCVSANTSSPRRGAVPVTDSLSVHVCVCVHEFTCVSVRRGIAVAEAGVTCWNAKAAVQYEGR